MKLLCGIFSFFMLAWINLQKFETDEFYYESKENKKFSAMVMAIILKSILEFSELVIIGFAFIKIFRY